MNNVARNFTPEKRRARQQGDQEALAAMEESGATQASLTDPDSRRMRKVGVGYNGPIAACAGIGVKSYVPRPKKGSAEAGGRW